MASSSGDRAQSRNFAVVVLAFLGGIVAAGLMWIFLNPAFEPLMSMAQQNTSTAAASTGITYARRGWQHFLFFAMLLLGGGALAGAAAVKNII